MPAQILLLSLLLLWLSGCAPTAQYPAGEAILRGEAPAPPPRPDSLRAELELTGFQGGRKSSASAAFSAVPGQKYKLDLYGLPGMVGASFLWTDTGWTLVLYEREGYLQGSGDSVDLPGLGIESVPVHDLFGFLWGDFFPGDSRGGGRDSGGQAILPESWEKVGDGRIRYRAGGHGWRVRLDERTGVVREAVREDSAFRIVYRDYRARPGSPVPRKVQVFSGRRPILEIEVESVEGNPAWKRNPFRIRIPRGFSPLPASPGG